MSDSIGIAILAAGKGTRLKLDIPKALSPLLGKTLIDYVAHESLTFSKSHSAKADVSVVVGHLKELVISHLEKQTSLKDINFSIQKEQLGTADALKAFFEADVKRWQNDYTLVVCADTPLLQAHDFEQLLLKLKTNPELVGVAATFLTDSPKGYGRIKKGQNGFSIIEEKDATDDERKINEVNSGLYLFKTSHIKENLFKVNDKNKSAEFYLTDLFQPHFKVVSHLCDDHLVFQGVNTLIQLEEVAQVLQKRVIDKLMLEGVRFINRAGTYIEPTVKIETGSIIYPNVILEGNTHIGKNSVIESGVTIKGSKIGSNTHILSNSYLEDCEIQNEISIGPMARIRPGTVIQDKSKVGNFVEIKKSHLHKGVKISHLSYVGDAEIGEMTNIGCGFITCNYDGANKHKTIIGKNSFIGSDCQMVAPITIGDEVYIASGSTINRDVPDGAFAIAREKQVTKESMAKRFLK